MNNKGGLSALRQAIVLLSGGLDSAATLYIARKQGFECRCLTFDYGQRHRKELFAARKIAQAANCKLEVIKIDLPWKGSALLDREIKISACTKPPSHKVTSNIPNTYVPARNIIFLSFALSYAEAIKAQAIFIGAHAQDYSGYPDCRAGFYRAFGRVISAGTKAGVERKTIKIMTPLMNKDKSRIVRLASRLGVPLEATWSCYKGKKRPCGECDSCYFRAKGFKGAGIRDPLTSKSR